MLWMESISFVPIKAWNHCFTHCSIENLVTSSHKTVEVEQWKSPSSWIFWQQSNDKKIPVRLDTMMKGKQTCWKAVTQLFVWRRNTVQCDFQKHKCTAGKRTSCLFADLLNLFYSCREGSKMHFISTTVPTETFCISKKARATYRVLAGTECWPPWSLALRNILFFVFCCCQNWFC